MSTIESAVTRLPADASVNHPTNVLLACVILPGNSPYAEPNVTTLLSGVPAVPPFTLKLTVYGLAVYCV